MSAFNGALVKTDLPFTHRDTDRHGNVRVYFRRKVGERKTRLRGKEGSVEFLEAYKAALKASEAKAALPESTATPLSKPAVPGSFRWLCVQYLGSEEWARLGAGTKRARRKILEHIWLEKIAPDSERIVADMPLSRFDAKVVKMLRDRKAKLPGAARERIKVMSPVFAWGMENDIEGVTINPCRDVKRPASAGDGHHTWTPEEIAQYETRHPIGTKARLALVLLLIFAQRRADATLFGRQHVRSGWIKYTQHKNREKKPVEVEMPMPAAVQAVIDATPTGDLTFLVNDYGHPFTPAGFGNKMRQWCDEAGLPQCSAHGLRKARAAGLASLGAPPHEIMAVTGHRTLAEVERYTKAYDRRRSAESAFKRSES
jgi:integrase